MKKSMENMHTDVRVIKGKGLFSNLVLVDVLASEHRPIRRNNLSIAVIYSKKTEFKFDNSRSCGL